MFQSFLVNPAGSLSVALNTTNSLGANPQYIAALSNGKVGVVNTSTGSARVINTTDSGATFNTTAPVEYIQLPANVTKEEVSNPSMILEYGNELWIPDTVGFVLDLFASSGLIVFHLKGKGHHLACH